MTETGFDALLRRAADGDRAAADVLARRYRTDLENALHRRLGQALRGRLDTEDVVQSTFAVAFRDLPSFENRGEGAFLAWLLRIAENRVQDSTRYHRRMQRDVRREVRPTSIDRQPGGQETPSLIASRGEERDRLHEAVGSLPQTDRDVVMMRAFESLAFAEIAERLGLPSEDAARHRYARAVRRLSDRMKVDDAGAG